MNKQMNYQFNLDIKRVYLYIGEKCEVKIWWKKEGKGGKGITTQNSIRLSGNQQYFDVNEKLSIIGKVTIQNGAVKEKPTLLRVMIFFPTKNQNKLGGDVTLNLNQIISFDSLQEPKTRKFEEPLQNCPVNNSRIIFTLSAIPYKQEDFLHDISFQATNSFSKTSDLTFRPEERKKGNSNYSKEKPMEFSFNPSQNDRERIGVDNTELVKDLKEVIEEKNLKIRRLEKQIDRVQNFQSQKNSQKTLSLMNQLNTTLIYNEKIKKQNDQLLNKFNKTMEEKLRQESEIKKMKEEKDSEKRDFEGKLENRERMIDDLAMKVKESEKRFQKFQDELFKKQADLIHVGKESEFKIKELTVEKNLLLTTSEKSIAEKEGKLKMIQKSFYQLKASYEQAYHEKEDLRRKFEEGEEYKRDLEAKLKKQQTIHKNFENETEKELQIWKRKYNMIETNFKEKEEIILQIEKEFKIIVGEKDEEGKLLREKFNSACQKIDELQHRLEQNGDNYKKSYENQISTLNIRIKSLQQICTQLQKSVEEKDQILEKAKVYVKNKEDEIQKKDQLIEKAKSYIQSKQKQFSQYKGKTESQTNEKDILRKQVGEKQRILSEYISELHQRQKQIEDMQRHIDYLRERITNAEDHIDEVQRKNESQEETLKDLVKKNLQMQIQINIKNYEIQSLKSK